jgi:hypothetical protein
MLFILVLIPITLVISQTPYAQLKTTSKWPGEPADALGSPLFKRGSSFIDNSREFAVNNFEKFAEVYKARPIKQNQCGVRINHALAIYTMLKNLQPDTIIESGVNAGQSTYFFRAAAPQAKIISIDPKMEGVCNEGARWIDDTNNVYLTGTNFKDLTEIDWSNYGNITNNPKTVVFIDDHLPVLTRIPALLKSGFSNIIIEDNYMHGEPEENVGIKGMLYTASKEGKDFAQHIEVYSEFPPLVYGLKFAHLSAQSVVKRRMTAKLHHTTDFTMITRPLLWLDDPSTGEDDLKWYHRFMQMLNMKVDSTKDWKQFNELMIYNQILYMKLKKTN